MTRASAATAAFAAIFALACAEDGGREHADAEAGLSSDAGGPDDAAYGDGEADVGVDGDGGGAVSMDGGSTVLDASLEAGVVPNEAGAEGSMGQSCPTSCNLGLVCDPALGRCCACVVGE